MFHVKPPCLRRVVRPAQAPGGFPGRGPVPEPLSPETLLAFGVELRM